MTARIERIDAAAALRREVDRLWRLTLFREQTACEHPAECVVEGAHIPIPDGHSVPPYLVCRACGYAEELWCCGAWRLAHAEHRVPRIARDEAAKLVRGLVKSGEDLAQVRFDGRSACSLWDLKPEDIGCTPECTPPKARIVRVRDHG